MFFFGTLLIFHSCYDDTDSFENENIINNRSFLDHESYLRALLFGQGELAERIPEIFDRNSFYDSLPSEISPKVLDGMDLIFDEYISFNTGIVKNFRNALLSKSPEKIEQSIREINTTFYNYALSKEISVISTDSTILELIESGVIDAALVTDIEKAIIEKNYDGVFKKTIELDSIISGHNLNANSGGGGGGAGPGGPDCVAATVAYAAAYALSIAVVIASAVAVGTSVVAANTINISNTVNFTNTMNYSGVESLDYTLNVSMASWAMTSWSISWLTSNGSGSNRFLLSRGELPTDDMLLEMLVSSIVSTL